MFVAVGVAYASAVVMTSLLNAAFIWPVNTSPGIDVLLTICPMFLLAVPAGWVLVKHVKSPAKLPKSPR
jgi:hypothetical protein